MENMFAKFAEIKPTVWGILALLVVTSAILLVKLISSKDSAKETPSDTANRTRVLVYGGLCISLSFVLSYIKLFSMPYGGTITLVSMLPIILYSVVFGPVAGIIAGVAYGFLQLIQDMYFVHWAQLFLDYPLAFGLLGFAGFSRKNIPLAASIGIIGRFLMHTLSGTIFFAEYAPEGMNPVLYSAMYNGSYLGVEFVITVAVGVAISYSAAFKYLRNTMHA